MSGGRLNVRLTPEHLLALDSEAEAEGVTPSRWCALVIDRALKRKHKGLPKLRERGGLNGARAKDDGE
jgi:hypothetical protein